MTTNRPSASSRARFTVGWRAAATVLASSMATVMGPTPPGTGVRAPATSATSGATSPTIRSPARWLPTSTTAAPGLTISGVIMAGRPAAATSTSACLVNPDRPLVPVWQRVTVALAPGALADSSTARGRPTSRPRPTMTAWLPSTGTRSRRSSSTMPMAVQGANRGSPRSSRPSFSGCSPSTSLAGSMASWTSTGSSPAGSGSWTRMPWTPSSALSSATAASTSFWEASAGSSTRRDPMPERSAARCLEPT